MSDRSIPGRLRALLVDGADEGSSLIEFAVCMPPLMLIVTGIMTFGIALNNYLSLTNAVSVAARQVSIARGQTTDPCALSSGAVYAAAPNLKQSSLNFTLVLNGSSYAGTSCSSASSSSGAAGNMQVGTAETLTVTFPCSLKVYGINLSPSCMLQSQVTEAME